MTIHDICRLGALGLGFACLYLAKDMRTSGPPFGATVMFMTPWVVAAILGVVAVRGF